MSAYDVAGLKQVEAQIGHVFRDKELLVRALTHVSAQAAQKRTKTYQRLEFLGDRVLGLIVSDMLYASFPDADEGELSRRLADLVRKESCAEVSKQLGVSPYVFLGGGELKSGRENEAILADVCESLIGAIYLDGGYETVRQLVVSWFEPRMHMPRRPLRDAKTSLQEWVQARGLPAPIYREISRSGPAHAPSFVIGVDVRGFTPIEASGSSKRIAEQAAAEAFMRREGVWQS
jgi:ribonuclease III